MLPLQGSLTSMDSDVLERQELTGGNAIKDNDGSIAVAAVSSSSAVAADGIDGYISQLDKDGNIQQGFDSQTQ